MIYTKYGDNGVTMFRGESIKKDSYIVTLVGEIDEAQANIGLLYELSKEVYLIRVLETIKKILDTIYLESNTDFLIKETKDLEFQIDINMPQPLNKFVLPIGGVAVSVAHIARVVVRRVERLAVTYIDDQNILQYFNRLSDYLFSLAIKISQ